ncbi:MAG UNVERIFIED_CONTAM: hypothetical protein LVT10_14980 [Anaerolineae bacterium]|jgi:glutamate dehydrogenase
MMRQRLVSSLLARQGLYSKSLAPRPQQLAMTPYGRLPSDHRVNSRAISSTNRFGRHSHDEVAIPGLGSSSHFGSLGGDSIPLTQQQQLDQQQQAAASARPWQAEHNLDVQRVTQNAIIYELTQQQTRTIQSVVPWFLENMPESYFRQVPEKFRMDHIKAIAAVKDANMDLYL